jgi:hypothetical protein
MKYARPTWDATREPNLLRNTASGKHYGRFILGGKQKWVNLETDVWTIAKARLANERAKFERLRRTADGVTARDARMGALAALYRQRIEDRGDIQPKTKRRLREEVETIIKTWPGSAATVAPEPCPLTGAIGTYHHLGRRRDPPVGDSAVSEPASSR